MTMIERMAEALWNSNKPPNAPDYDGLSNVDKFQVELIARDVLKAMREPTESMLGAEGVGTSVDHCSHIDRSPEEYWKLMIEAALKEGED